jgi:hypothetical protein
MPHHLLVKEMTIPMIHPTSVRGEHLNNLHATYLPALGRYIRGVLGSAAEAVTCKREITLDAI